jgi:hypothetical protein
LMEPYGEVPQGTRIPTVDSHREAHRVGLRYGGGSASVREVAEDGGFSRETDSAREVQDP